MNFDTGNTLELIAPYLEKSGGVISALRAIVLQQGFINSDAMVTVADAFNISHADVRGIVSFYEDLREQPAGRHLVRICQAEACQAMGARELTSHAESDLGVTLGATTQDGNFTLESVYCLGLCACAPVITIDGRLHGRVDGMRFDTLMLTISDE